VTVRRIANTVQGLAVSQDPGSIRNDRQAQTNPGSVAQGGGAAFFDVGTVKTISGTHLTVSFRGQVTKAVMATDEPLKPDQRVWLLTANDGTLVVLGSVKS